MKMSHMRNQTIPISFNTFADSMLKEAGVILPSKAFPCHMFSHG